MRTMAHKRGREQSSLARVLSLLCSALLAGSLASCYSSSISSKLSGSRALATSSTLPGSTATSSVLSGSRTLAADLLSRGERVLAADLLSRLSRPASFKPDRAVTVTAYNATRAQCDLDPATLADGSRINPLAVSSLRICALSRNLLKRWGGSYQFGDTILLKGIGKHSGYWVVRDVMAERFVDYVDLLLPIGTGRDVQHKDIVLYAHEPMEE